MAIDWLDVVTNGSVMAACQVLNHTYEKTNKSIKTVVSVTSRTGNSPPARKSKAIISTVDSRYLEQNSVPLASIQAE